MKTTFMRIGIATISVLLVSGVVLASNHHDNNSDQLFVHPCHNNDAVKDHNIHCQSPSPSADPSTTPSMSPSETPEATPTPNASPTPSISPEATPRPSAEATLDPEEPTMLPGVGGSGRLNP